MNKDFEKGSILEFNENIGTIIVLGNLEYEGNLYILVCPIRKKENDVIESDMTKMILFKEEDNELYTEIDSKIIGNVVPEILKREKINLD